MLPLAVAAGLVLPAAARGAKARQSGRESGATPGRAASGKTRNRMNSKSRFFDAVKAGDLTRVRALMEHEPSLVNATDEAGLPAVLVATYHGHKAVADALIERGAELD